MSATGSGNADAQRIAAGVYTIDPARSVVSFQTRAIFGLTGVKGTFDLDSGTVTVADPVEDSTVEAVVSASGFSSGNTQRDNHVRSADYLDAERHPHFSFVGERLERSGERGVLVGRLTVKGVTQPQTLDITNVSGDEHGLTARATTTVDRFDYGVTKAPGMTGRKLHITLDVAARR
ncbi:YceI family protein [Streptomonospora litoralis]|uniref:Lipid/polyisoprenoid-binding YceI-like domain-containing protein n=1 Tax=Streptomonospora litoralis TaxID=2498135 RepID=A0A4P6Q0F3_9ACTN|nr:YceI family protein [Streptomonospora litoralis]QBI53955.1 hypothetical protein EKD16_10845 [Streptomonospora litoralis]